MIDIGFNASYSEAQHIGNLLLRHTLDSMKNKTYSHTLGKLEDSVFQIDLRIGRSMCGKIVQFNIRRL